MKQIDIAKQYVNCKENNGNRFDEHSPLGRMIKSAGQKDGEAWCAYFTEGIFCEAFPEKDKELRKLFSASAVQTYRNFKDAGYDCHDRPRVGDLVIWQKWVNGKPHWSGHAGIVINVLANGSFEAIEGNTNSAGSREGDSVQIKIRTLVKRNEGLNILGFITIK
jgi:hypothetical protein